MRTEWLEGAALSMKCPTCKAKPGRTCRSSSGKGRTGHQKRLDGAGRRFGHRA